MAKISQQLTFIPVAVIFGGCSLCSFMPVRHKLCCDGFRYVGIDCDEAVFHQEQSRADSVFATLRALLVIFVPTYVVKIF
jgi:hypothetical protein